MMDNIFIRILSRIFDLIVLNILWVVFCLPIVTIGASTTALYSVTLKMVVNEDGYLIRDFWRAFKRDFKQSTSIWLLLLVLGIFFGIDFVIVRRWPGVGGQIGVFVLGIAGLLYGLVLLFVFPLIAKFENTMLQMIKNALLIPVSRFPYTILCLLMTGMCVGLTFMNSTTVLIGSVVWTLIGGSVLAYANSLLMRKIFEPYIITTNENEE